ncbi:family 43 glycosylhydrolase [Hufsiella ginkgonis]|uniref:Family 43 glycosylhydrolase n=1 Tax=Hufsiella ginkgonis TaxID=2695274 RepID=A0A7K1Y386_9SPHI|nr:family 43 glycosylhydrolase [Hufsiella ginkgonis]MXV17745.1 family 43 glycosylhydrolase [Hufsiella ginkgonis]
MKKILFIILPLLANAMALLAQTPANPVITGADPHAIRIRKEYWVYPTNSSDTGVFRRADRFFGYASRDLVKWENRGTLILQDDIAWIKDDSARSHSLWAPAMFRKGKKYYLYYSVGPQNPTPSRIGVAVSNSPAHGFKDSGKQLLTGGNGFEAIDPMVFKDPRTKNTYLYCGGSAGAKLRVFKLKANLVEIDHEVEVAQPPAFTEGAFMHVRNGIYYLSYSHGSWNNSSYSVHYATSKSAVGPWDYKGVVLASDSTHKGPGHHSFLADRSGKKWYIVYHRWEKTGEGPYRGARKTAVEEIRFTKTGDIEPIKMTDGVAAK